MRKMFTIFIIMALAGSAMALDTGSVQVLPDKGIDHVLANPSSDREGGEDMAGAVAITALPFSDTGATCDNFDDWDEACPYTNSTSPDVWYSFTPGADMMISVDLVGSFYDTKTYILDANYNVIACNDDFYSDYTSLIEAAQLFGGVTYYIVIDGYGGDCGDYILAIDEFTPPPPCIVDCVGSPEGEPDNGPGYADMYNGGCNTSDVTPLAYTQVLEGDQFGNLTFCGVSGWTDTGRDTDWFVGTFGASGTVYVDIESEEGTNFYELGAMPDCANVSVVQNLTTVPCEVASMTISGVPGSPVYLWVGPAEFTPPSGFVGYNYNYRLTITGLQEGPVATDNATWDRLKSMYR